MRSENSIIKQLKKLKVTSFKKKNKTHLVCCACVGFHIWGKEMEENVLKMTCICEYYLTKYRRTEAHFKEISRLGNSS